MNHVHQIPKRTVITACLILFFFTLTPNLFASGHDYPLRAKYPGSPYITTDELNAEFATCLVIDVRSKFEYNVIHVQNAIHVPVSNRLFGKIVKGHQAKNPGKKIVFYCNGHTCAKSYKAEVKAKAAGVKGYVYDSGIFDWTQAHPDRSVLLGKSPADPNQIISKADFKAKNLPLEQFKTQAVGKNAILFDVRDAIQRKKTPDWAKGAQGSSMDKLAKNLKIPQFRNDIKGKTLYIFDAVGKQVKWLQYHIEKEGVSDYYFLKKGMWSVYGEKGAN